jgi:drug/metabolite transporter (DMT)-like permease
MQNVTDRVASNSNNTLARYVAFASVAIIWGTTWVAIKLSLQGYPPVIGATLRFVFAIAILGLYARVTRMPLVLPRHSIMWVAITAILVYVVNYGLVYWGEQYLSAGVTAILFAAVPLATMLGSAFAFRTESFRYRKLVGILFGFLGIVVFFDPLVATCFSTKVTLAAVAIVVAAMAAAFNIVIAKRHLMLVGAVPLTFHQMLWGTLGLGFISVITGEWRNVHYSLGATLAVLYLGLAGSVAFVTYYSLLKTMRASTLSTISYVTPFVAVFSGWIVLNESITLGVGSDAVASWSDCGPSSVMI